MRNKSYNTHTSITSYPGSERYYALCDICGKKYRKRELCLVEDKFNLQNRLLVCHADLDKAQPQLRPFIAREYKAPKVTRPEPYLQQYPNIPNPNSDMSPGICTQVVASVDPISGNILLQWIGPLQGGSDEVTSYNIYQATPQLSGLLLIGVTSNGAPFYEDINTTSTAICTYYVAANNLDGTGPISAPCFFPNIQVDLSVEYFTGYGPNYPVLGVTANGPYFVGYTSG